MIKMLHLVHLIKECDLNIVTPPAFYLFIFFIIFLNEEVILSLGD